MVRSERDGSLVGTIAYDAATRKSPERDSSVAKPFHDIVLILRCQTFSDGDGIVPVFWVHGSSV